MSETGTLSFATDHSWRNVSRGTHGGSL